MKTASAKAKGRRCAQEAREALLRASPSLEPGDIDVTPSGCTGVDLRLSPRAKRVYPFAIEAKNQERINIWQAIDQSKGNTKDSEYSLVVFRRNRSDLMVCLKFDDFLTLLRRDLDEAPTTDNP